MSRLLIFSATTGYRHESIPAGVAAARELGEADGFAVDATEDAAVFTPDNLARYSAVVFMNSSGTLFDDVGRSALRGYVAGGGGYLGVHLAAGTEYDWPYYGGLVGAYFDKHPEVQPAGFDVETGPIRRRPTCPAAGSASMSCTTTAAIRAPTRTC